MFSSAGEVVHASVITVPAALNYINATRRAKPPACGISGKSIAPEPVAAALAYGFQIGSGKSLLAVYDFGGGTFDAAIIKSEEGRSTLRITAATISPADQTLIGRLLRKLIAPRVVRIRAD